MKVQLTGSFIVDAITNLVACKNPDDAALGLA